MHTCTRALFLGSLLVPLLAFGSCSTSREARKLELDEMKDSLSIDPSLLKRGNENEAYYVYRNPKADIRRYQNVLIQPVRVAGGTEVTETQKKNMQSFAENAWTMAYKELSQDWTMVDTPAADTLMIQMTLLDASASTPVLHAVSSATPVGRGMGLIQRIAGMDPVTAGEITIEIVIRDGGTKEVLGAAVDRRVAEQNLRAGFDIWSACHEAIEKWSVRLRTVLAAARERARQADAQQNPQKVG
ncbi:MAG: hypothetical protein RL148_630 [Planctomycetota bacterium]